MFKKNNEKIGTKISQNKWNDSFKKKKDSFVCFCKDHYTNSFKILIAYIIFVLIGSILLYLPISIDNSQGYIKSNGEVYNFLDAVFVSSSAFSNTGLTVTDVSTSFTIFGQVIIYIWIQLGGFGLLSAFYLIGKSLNKVFHKKIISNSWISYAERGGTKISDSGTVLFSIFLMNIFIQTFFSIIFTIIFYNIKFYDVVDINGIWVQTSNVLPSYNNFGESVWNGFFLTGSAINNAGFDLFGSTSLAPFRNDIGILVQFLSMSLFIFGGIGYIVIYDIWQKIEYFIYRTNPLLFSKFFKVNSELYSQEKPKFSIFSKICLWGALIFGVLSVSGVLFIEHLSISNTSILGDNYMTYFNKNKWNANWSIIFNTLSTRSAGFASVNVEVLTDITKWIFIFLMFLGTAPASTGGGIRITTFIVLLKSLWAKIVGSNDIKILKKRISKRTTIDSMNIFGISTLLISFLTTLTAVFSIDTIELKGHDITDLVFETSSAFGTTGLSTGITSDLNYLAYGPMIILMFIGQLGITNTLQIFASKHSKDKSISYPNIEIKLG